MSTSFRLRELYAAFTTLVGKNTHPEALRVSREFPDDTEVTIANARRGLLQICANSVTPDGEPIMLALVRLMDEGTVDAFAQSVVALHLIHVEATELFQHEHMSHDDVAAFFAAEQEGIRAQTLSAWSTLAFVLCVIVKEMRANQQLFEMTFMSPDKVVSHVKSVARRREIEDGHVHDIVAAFASMPLFVSHLGAGGDVTDAMRESIRTAARGINALGGGGSGFLEQLLSGIGEVVRVRVENSACPVHGNGASSEPEDGKPDEVHQSYSSGDAGGKPN